MQDNLTIKGENIQRVYDWYLSDKFLVNRRYQRKLVWAIEEKKAFINSIISDFPVPLFLLATNGDKYEIIDGMQRLNALFTFIEGEFAIKVDDGQEKYFNLTSMPSTNVLYKKEKIRQKTPYLSIEICAQIANYQLPLSVSTFAETIKIEEIFRRINSNGKHLSEQELRQAGALGQFSDLVRIISSSIRRDSSPSDLLTLNNMKNISLSNVKLPYGINLNEVYWIKNQIITRQNMRNSRDEEVISYLLMYIILGDTVNPSATNLNIIFRFDPLDSDGLANRIEYNINKIGAKNIEKSFLIVFDELNKVITLSKKTFFQLLYGSDGSALARTFQIVFLSFYDLIIKENKEVQSYNTLVTALDGIGNRQLKNIRSSDWNGKYRNELIRSFKGMIDGAFILKKNIDNPFLDITISRFENILMHTIIEPQMYDFKIGLYDLRSGRFNIELFNKIIKTLTAMANTKPGVTGYVLIGVADNDKDASEFDVKYKVKSTKFQNYNVTGIQSEATLEYRDLDTYFNYLKSLVKKAPIDSYTCNFIIRAMRVIGYYDDKAILLFEIKSNNAPSPYDKKYFQREGNATVEIEFEHYPELFGRFKER